MADNYLITGYWGKPHVTAENDRGINAAIFGAGRFVLPVGNQFRAEYIGNNTIRVYDGKLIDNGAVAGIPAGQYVDLLVPETGQGLKRNDLIIFQYKKDASTLIESGVFAVVNGVETAGTPSDPELTQEDILSDTATFDQMALWRVSVAGSAISEPVQVFEVAKSMENAGCGVPIVSATSTNGVDYEATVENVDELYTGLEIIIIPNMTSTSAAAMLNVNGLGAKRIRMPISSSTSATTTPTYNDFYAKDKPVKLIYDKSSLNGIWRIVDKNRANALDLYGTTPIEKGGTGADNAKEARINLGVETAAGTVTSGNADFAEVGEWSDCNVENENRIGYFVCLDTDIPGVNMRKATINDDIRGVTVTAPAFSGNCSADKFDKTGALLPKYSYVACIGIVSVIDDGTCTVGKRCIPNENSIATATTGEYGYLVMERIDKNHVLIALEPSTDYQYKTNVLIKGILEKLKTNGQGGGDVPSGDGGDFRVLTPDNTLGELESCRINYIELGIPFLYADEDDEYCALLGVNEFRVYFVKGSSKKILTFTTNGLTENYVTLKNPEISDFGGEGDAGNITINGTELKFFVGKEKDYDALDEEAKENLLAIITDSTDSPGSTTPKIYSYPDTDGSFVSILENSTIEIGKLPDGRTVDDIVGVGLEGYVNSDDFYEYTEDTSFRISSGRTSDSVQDRTNGSLTDGGYLLPFTLSARGGEYGRIVTSIDVEIGSSIDGKLYIYFKRGSCYYFDPGTGSYVLETLNHKKFKLRKLYYWFA